MLIKYVIAMAILANQATSINGYCGEEITKEAVSKDFVNCYRPKEVMKRYSYEVVSKAFEKHGMGAADRYTPEEEALGGKTLYEILDQIHRVAEAAHAKAPLGEKEFARESVHVKVPDILNEFVEENWYTRGVRKSFPKDWYNDSRGGICVNTREELINTLELAEISSKRRSSRASNTPESTIYAARERYFRCMKEKALNGVLLPDDAAKCAANNPSIRLDCSCIFSSCWENYEEKAFVDVTKQANRASIEQAFQACETQDELLKLIKTLRSNAEDLASNPNILYRIEDFCNKDLYEKDKEFRLNLLKGQFDNRASFFRCLEKTTSSSQLNECPPRPYDISDNTWNSIRQKLNSTI